jgi:carotenoid cleavage dioxygenase-like enzyme
MNAVNRTNPVLAGNYAPVDREVVVGDLEVIGEIPKDMNGVYVRNGTNRRYAAQGRYHWFDGDGMLHGAYFERPRHLPQPLGAHEMLPRGGEGRPRAVGGHHGAAARRPPDMPLKDTSNTDVKFHAGKLVTMWYLSGSHTTSIRRRSRRSDRPTSGHAATHVSAHSKVDEQTDEFIYFDYGKEGPT